MSLKLGTQDISGISQNTKYNAHHLLDFKWTDCIMNDVSWLRADTFSWQSGDVYTSAYNHLVADLQGTTAETETIGSYTVTFYRADDGHKICLADQETTVLNIYNETGIAWYYIVDTVNTQFKLPRTKYGFEGLRTNVGDNINPGLPNITGQTCSRSVPQVANNAFYTVTGENGAPNSWVTDFNAAAFDASLSNSIYGNSDTVQPPATQMYLYFYVGDYSQTAVEQTAGLNAELFNGKADTDLSNVLSSKGILTESYVNGTSWYRVYSDGWCEQGGITLASYLGTSVVFMKPYVNTNYTMATCAYGNNGTDNPYNGGENIGNRTISGFTFYVGDGVNKYCCWQASGYIS